MSVVPPALMSNIHEWVQFTYSFIEEVSRFLSSIFPNSTVLKPYLIQMFLDILSYKGLSLELSGMRKGIISFNDSLLV